MHPLDDFLTALGFFSRLPVPSAAHGRSVVQAAALAPAAGAVIALGPALLLMLFSALGVPPAIGAALALALLVALTGALHEDGLGDCADGFGGGTTRLQKLAIMRDSRIGTFAACAIALSLFIRAAALAQLSAEAPIRAATALIASAAISRAICLWPLALLPPARTDGLAVAAGAPDTRHLAAGAILAGAISLMTGPAGFGLSPALLAMGFAAAAVLGLAGLAHRQIGGATGDVAGAAQQVAEIACLAVFASAG